VSDAEHPEDEQRPDDQEAAAEEVPAESAEEPAAAEVEAPEPAAAEAEAPEPEPEPAVAEAEAEAPEPAAAEVEAEAPEPAEEPQPAEPVAAAAQEPEAEVPEPAEAEEPAAAAEAEAPEPAEAQAEAPAPAAEEPQQAEPAAAAAAEPHAGATEDEGEEEEELSPRQRPEIPGADLIPDIVSDSDEFLDAEARAAAEAEAEAAAAREEEQDTVAESQPIADAAIDLAAGARYTATGKRKTAVARVILKPGSGTYAINGKELDTFFPRETLQRIIRQPLEAVGYESRMDVVARMHGGGVAAQAGALRHGISRALLEADPNLRGELKRRGFLTRDPRVKERKKAGLKKARKRPQFSKR
jgi:small subunit ribosomal protein S9